jgi:hypothetical protein
MKRTFNVVQQDVRAIEPEVGDVVSYYDDGWRVGHIHDLELDDNGEYVIEIRPMGRGRLKKKGGTERHPVPLITARKGDFKLGS